MKKLLQFYQKFNQKSSQNRPTSVQNRPKIGPKSVPDGPKSVQNRLPGPSLGPKTGKTGKEISKKLEWQQRTHEHFRADLYFWPKCRQHGPNLAPQTDQKSEKIDLKIDQILSCFWDRVWTPKSFQKRPQK